MEVDCKNIRSKAINSYYYSKEGAVISYINAPDADWDFYPPGSIGELFIKGVCKQVGGADWKLLGSNAVSVCYYDSQSITRPSMNIVRGSKYCSFTAEAKTYFAGTIGKTIEGRRTLENMSYSIDLWEINCKNKVVSLVSVTLYSKEGKVVGVEDHVKSPVTRSIVPTSLDDLLYKEVCK